MDIEQLKLIISAITGLAGETKTVLIWYFVVTFVGKFIGWGLIAGVVVFIVKTIASLILRGIASSDSSPLSYRREIWSALHRAWLYNGDNGQMGITNDEYSKACALLGFEEHPHTPEYAE